MKPKAVMVAACAAVLGTGSTLASQTMRLPEAKWETQAASNNFVRVLTDGEWAAKAPKADPKTEHCQWMKRTFVLPEGWERDRVRLDFWRIDGNGVVFVNGRRAGEALGPYCEVEFTDLAQAGTNTLEIFLTRNYTGVSRTAESDVLRSGSRGPKGENWTYDKWPLSISGPIDVIRLPRPASVSDVFVRTSVRNWEIAVDAEIDASAGTTHVWGVWDSRVTVECDIFDELGVKVKKLPPVIAGLKPGVNAVTVRDAWKDPRLWDVGEPNLYRAVVSVRAADGREIDSKTAEFGFREVWTEGRQVYLNGHVQRFRVEGAWFGLTRNSVGLWQALGRNMVLDQPHPNKWWYFNWWKDCAIIDPEMLWVCDHYGICAQEPVPTVNRVVPVFRDPRFKSAYEDETLRYMRRYRNHPSIILWAVSMNFINPKNGIHPDLIGQRTTEVVSERQEVCDWAISAVKRLDPTRLVYTHADGNIGDIASGNCYPNITPIQEISDYLEVWREKGDMPYLASEYDAVYDGTYGKCGGSPALAEIGAINMGPAAFNLVSWNVQTNLSHGYGGGGGYSGQLKAFVKGDPVYWGIQESYVKSTDRAWRMDGASGWHYFHGANYGYPTVTEKRGNRVFTREIRYGQFTEPFSGRPEWLSSNFYIHAANMQPLLAYIGGKGRHSDKTHTYLAGRPVEKSVCLAWDGAKPESIDYQLLLAGADGKGARPFSRGKVTLRPGEVREVPFRLSAPSVKARTDFRLMLTVTDGARRTTRDAFDITVFPAKFEPLAAKRKVKLWDPQGKSGWVAQVVKGVETLPATNSPAASLDPANDLLVIGREALAVNDELPYDPAAVARGLRVIVLEQQPAVWEAWGFKCIEPMPRKVFAGVGAGKSLFEGLAESDLSYWRGTCDMYPEFKLPRPKDFSPHPKGSNRHGMSSTVMATPTEPGFLPLLTAEYDLAYSPLLEYRDGNGAVIFSALDFSGRADGTEPAAQRFARNLVAYADALVCSQSRKVKVNFGTRAADTDAFLESGGVVLNVGFGAEELAKCGLKGEARRTIRPVPDGELALFAERRLTYFREFLGYAAITAPGAATEGLWYRRGDECFLQADPQYFSTAFKDDGKALANTAISSGHLHDLVSRAVTYLGAEPSAALREEMASIRHKPGYENLSTWHVIGPFWTRLELADTNKLDIVHSAEKRALAGDLNPNFTYPNEKGVNLDFRTSISADANNCVDFRQTFKGQQTDETAIGYAIKTIMSDCDRDALLRLGFDWYMKVYLNGELVVDWSAGLGCNPRANMRRCILHLKKGENVLVFKQRSGAGGFCFWANISEPGLSINDAGGIDEPVSPVYARGCGTGGEYFFTYW